jgi:glutamate/aspartate transport system substrate-binding protein
MNFSLTRRLLAVAAFAMCIAPTTLSAQELTGTLAKISESGEIVIGHRESSVPFPISTGPSSRKAIPSTCA